jgi:DNA polymerase III alpha subunit
MVPDLFLLGVPLKKVVVTEHNEDTRLFNQLNDEPLADHKEENDLPDMSWNIPPQYRNIDLRKHVMALAITPEYKTRVDAELKEIEKRGMEMLVKTLIYVIDELKSSGTVWGVGRGSSCASLVLYLIGLHKVDPVRFNIPMTEFFHD